MAGVLPVPPVSGVTARPLLFVGGKGGTGKTVVSKAIARLHAEAGRRTLWVAFEDPSRPPGDLRPAGRNLWELNCEAAAAFEQYAGLKIGAPRLTHFFVNNRLMRYLSEAAPGIHELVLLGKVWHERRSYDRVVIDLPSTGYGLAMFQSTANFARLFRGGPIHRDAEAMLATFGDPGQTGHLIVSLPEEMPLVESLELREHLLSLFPRNGPALVVNRLFPSGGSPVTAGATAGADSCLARSPSDYAARREELERSNLRLWESLNSGGSGGSAFGRLDWVPPEVVERLARQASERGYA